jgi:hypothetical protein
MKCRPAASRENNRSPCRKMRCHETNRQCLPPGYGIPDDGVPGKLQKPHMAGQVWFNLLTL